MDRPGRDTAGSFLLLPCSWALLLLVGPHHADQLCRPAVPLSVSADNVHLGLLLTLPAPYEALVPKPLRPCFVHLAKPAAASAFSLALLHLRPLLARGISSAAAPRDLLCCTWKRPTLRAASPSAQPWAPPCASPSRAPPPGAIIDRSHASWRCVPWCLRSLGLARRTGQTAAATFRLQVRRSC